MIDDHFRRGMLCAGLSLGMWLCAPCCLSAPPPQAERLEAERYAAAREKMVQDDIAGGGVSDARVIQSMRSVPRHEFVPGPQRASAYFDMSLPIGEAQTISGAFVVAYMTEKLEPKPTDRVLEIGTGSGYQAAVLASLVQTVYSIEINKTLGTKVARTLARLGYRNVITKIGDGFLGWPEYAPFDKIIVTCSPEEIPKPLIEQLAEGGRMIIPVGERYEQTLMLLSKRDGVMVQESLVPSLFVPMTGAAEEARKVQPDGTRPALENGGFEDLLPPPSALGPHASVPTAWYYGRQADVVRADDAPQGTHYLRLENNQPGRPAQMFQGFPVDGRVVGQLSLSLSLRAEGIRNGLTPDESPVLAVRFFDGRRSRSANTHLGPWRGTFAWKAIAGKVPVPVWARDAIVQIGMLGGTGRLEVDDLRIQPLPR